MFHIFFPVSHSLTHLYIVRKAKINIQSEKWKQKGKKWKYTRKKEPPAKKHAMPSNETENLSHSRSILHIFMISVVWPILLRLFTEWKMNMNTRNRDIMIFFYFHFAWFFLVKFSLELYLRFKYTYVCVRVSNGAVVWRFNSTADGIHFTFCLVEFVSKYIRRTWYLLYSSHLLFSSTKQHNIFCNHLSSINFLHILKIKLFFTARMYMYSCSGWFFSFCSFVCFGIRALCVLYYQVKHYN